MTTNTQSKTSKQSQLQVLAEKAAQCRDCALHTGRTTSVFSDGNPDAPLMLIGEGPGQKEDESGTPFVGRSGKLLTQLLWESGKIDRQKDIYICNIVKCRPPDNRAPLPDEMDACFSFLEEQINIIRPRYILLTGATAMKGILKVKTGITKVRGQWFNTPYHGAKAMPILHPAYLLRYGSEEEGKPKWLMRQDLKEVRRVLDALDLKTALNQQRAEEKP